MRRATTLPVLLGLALLVGLVPLPVGAQEAAHEQVVDLTFPTDPRATYTDDYANPRSGGRTHRATDLMGEMGWPVFAAVGGTVVWAPGYHSSAGGALQIRGVDGRTYAYYHLGPAGGSRDDAYAPGIAQGVEVERGQHIGFLGDSGNAAGGTPHLHFEIADAAVVDPYGSNRINPYPSLRDAEARRDYATPEDDHEDEDVDGPEPTVDRVAGRTRVETAVALSQDAFDAAEAVVLADGGSFPDSVIAGPLAAALGAPVLTTFGEELEPEVAEEIRRLGATTAYVIGPRSRVSAAVERAVVNETEVAPADLHRITGLTDPETAALVAERVVALTGATEALVALGSHPVENRDWPDALAASYHGARSGLPVLLVAHEAVPSATLDALADVETALLVGGTAAISEESEATIADVVGDVRRLSGESRFVTSSVVADDLIDRGLVDRSRLWAATGHGYADALTAAGALAVAGELFVLIDGRGEGGDTGLDPWFARHADAIEAGRVIGGDGVVNAAAVDALLARIR
jgi:putative cell wall-binding protein